MHKLFPETYCKEHHIGSAIRLLCVIDLTKMAISTSPCSNNTNITPYRKKGQLETAHHIEIKPTLLRWISLSPEDRQGYDKSGRRSQDICCNAKEVEELEHHIEMTPMQIAVGVRVCAFLVQTCFVLSVHFCVERKRRG